MGSIPTLVRVFLCPCVGPFPSVGLTLTWFIWDRNRALHITLYSVNSLYDSVMSCHVLCFCKRRAKRIRCEPCSLALYHITYTMGRCSDARVSCGWRTIEWVKTVRINRTYPPLYVLGMVATRLATIELLVTFSCCNQLPLPFLGPYVPFQS